MLLLWGTLQPHGNSKLSSVRFSGPVRIRSIRIFPKGFSLFARNPDAISQTEPDAFTFSIFLNAQAAPSVQEPKPKGTNVLVPTRLLYPGGLRDIPLDMGPDFVTRLMILQGDFLWLTLAVYGEAVSEPPSDPIAYNITSLPSVTYHRLPPALDPANASDPSLSSLELISLIPHSPPLPSIIRSILCLKSTDEDWNNNPCASLEQCIGAEVTGLNWLEQAARTMKTLLNEDVNQRLLKQFAERIRQALVEKTNDHVYALAGLLRHISAQPNTVTSIILESLDLPDIFESHLLDKHIVERLHDAAANPMIAHALGSTPMLATLYSFRVAHTTSPPAKQATTALQQRILGWERLEKALSNPLPDLTAVALWIKGLASEDLTWGVFLISMLEDDSLSSKISRLPVPDLPVSPAALWDSTALASFTEFVAFLRAFTGLSHMMVALCWADSLSDAVTLERIFSMIRLWQEVDGYREIINHLLLLPQLMHRLESVLRHATLPPSISFLQVEQIMTCLCVQSETMTRPELANLVDALPASFTTISEDKRLEMTEVVTIAECGLSQAVRTLLEWQFRLRDVYGSYALQAALLLLEKVLEDRENGEWKVLQAAWEAGSHGLVYQLVELFVQLVIPVQGQFLLTPPPSLQPSVLAQSLLSANAAMRVLSRLLPGNPIPSRLTRILVQHIASLFIATDAVDARYPQGSAARQAARVARPTCADTLSILSYNSDDSESSAVTAELILRTLLHVALYPEGDDPVTRLEQVFWLLDLLLPLSISDATGDRLEERFWVRKVIVHLLPDMQRFSRALAVDYRMQFLRRLTALDRGEVGLGQWLFDEELKHLLQAIESLKTPQLESDRRYIFQAEVTNSVEFLTGVIVSQFAGDTPEFFNEQRTLHDISRVFSTLAGYPAVVPGVVDLACAFAPHATRIETRGQLAIAVTLLRSAKPIAFIHAGSILSLAGRASTEEAKCIAGELGLSLQELSSDESQTHWQQEEKSLAQAVVHCLSWLAKQSLPELILIPGVSGTAFSALISRVTTSDPQNAKTVSDLSVKFTFSDDIVMSPRSDGYEPFVVTYERLYELLTARPKTPPTPRLSGESIFKMATMSPVAALVGASRTSTLTKTYQNNDFRQMSVRQNTSRRPSMHVDVGR